MSLAKSYDVPVPDRRWKTRKFVADYGVYIALVILLLAGAVLTPKLYSVDTIAVVMRQASQLGIVAIGQTMVLLVAGLDLSVGGIFIMTSVVVAEVGNGRNEMVIPAIATAMTLGGLVGLSNGLLVTKRRVPPFVATLGMLVLVKGATQAYTRGVPGGFVPEVLGIVNRSWSFLSVPLILWFGLSAIFIFILRGIGLTISSSPVGKASREVMMFYVQKIGPVPIIAWMFVLLILLTMLLLRFTVFGKYLYAVGGNLEVARLSGVPIKAVRYGVYVLCSLTAAVTGLLWLSRMGVGDPAIGDGIELQTITAVIIGGTSLFGGRASVLGTLGGVLLLGITANLLVMLGVNQFIQGLIQGVIIVAAVALYKQEGE